MDGYAPYEASGYEFTTGSYELWRAWCGVLSRWGREDGCGISILDFFNGKWRWSSWTVYNYYVLCR